MMMSSALGTACGDGALEVSKRPAAASSPRLDLLPKGLARLEARREMTGPKPLLAGLAVATRNTVLSAGLSLLGDFGLALGCLLTLPQ